jgi:hypothetical protein
MCPEEFWCNVEQIYAEISKQSRDSVSHRIDVQHPKKICGAISDSVEVYAANRNS